MSTLAAILLLLLAVLALRGGRRPREEAAYLAIHGAVTLLALASLATARLGHFTPWLASLLALATAALMTLRRLVRAPLPLPEPERPVGLALAALLALCGLLYTAFPATYLLGGRDQGTYLLTAVTTARHGRPAFDLPVLDTLDPDTRQHLVHDHAGGPFLGALSPRQRYDSSAPWSRLVPQFMHLFPSLGAWAFGVGGLGALIRLNGLLTLLALWSIFRLGRGLAGRGVGLGVAIALGLCPATIYWARSTMSEPLALVLGLHALELWRLAWRDDDRTLAGLAGLTLGLAVLCRLTGLLWAFGVGGMILGAAAAGRAGLGRRALAGWLLGAGCGLADGWFFSRPYLLAQWDDRGLIMLVALQAALPLAWLVSRWLGRRPLTAAMTLGAFAVMAWVAFALLLFPHVVSEPRFEHRSARELSWYVTPLALPLAAWGLRLLARREDALAWAPLAAAAGATIVAMTIRPSIWSDHPWCSRRWLPIVFPCALLLAGLAVSARPRLARWLLVGYLGWAGAFAWPWLFTAEQAGLPAQLARVAGRLEHQPDDRPLLATDIRLAMALTYYHQIPTLWIATPDGRRALRDGTFDGWRLVGLDASRPELGVSDVIDEAAGRIEFPALNGGPGRWPRPIFTDSLSAATGTIRASARRPIDIDLSAGHPSLRRVMSRRDGETDAAISGGPKGMVLGGPYRWLPAGRYELTFEGAVERDDSGRRQPVRFWLGAEGRMLSEVVALRRGELPPPGRLATIPVALPTAVDKVEVMVRVRDGVILRLDRVRLRRLGD